MLEWWERISKPKKIIAAIVIIFVIPLCIHVAFKISAFWEFFRAEWSAGDLLAYYGAFLAFLGPTVLAYVALKQNKQYKADNDKAQERLERINTQANELNLINTILDFQLLRYQRIDRLLDEFGIKTASVNFLKIYYPGEIPISGDYNNYKIIKKYYEWCEDCNALYLEISRFLHEDYRLSSQSKELLQITKELRDYLIAIDRDDLINYISDSNNKETPNYVDEITRIRTKFYQNKNTYLDKLNFDLTKAMYTPMTLEEVRNLFNPRKKEEPTNGKNANANP